MLALTIRQPWAWAIMHGGKDVENRSWYVGRPVVDFAVHAGQRIDHDGIAWLAQHAPELLTRFRATLQPYGAVIGVVRLDGSTTSSPSRWARPGDIHWQLARPRPLSRAVACSGRLGLWTLPDDVEAEVLRQLMPRPEDLLASC